MELKKYELHRTYVKGKTRNQINLGEDYSLTEGKPDIEKLLQKKAEIQVEEVHTEKGKIRVRGKLLVWVLYLPTHSPEALGTLQTEIAFEDVLYLEEVVHGDQLKMGWNIDDFKVQIIHPGKINVRCVVTLYASVWAEEAVFVTEDVEDEPELFSKVEQFQAAACVTDQKEIYRIEEKVTLPANMPNVERVLWSTLQLRNTQVHPQEGRVLVQGELLFWTVYEGEGSAAPMQWLEKSMAFQGFVEVPGMTKGAFGAPGLELTSQTIRMQPDEDGELRVFELGAVVEIGLQMYEERSCRRLSDAYSTDQKISLATEQLPYERLRMCSEFKYPVSGREKISESHGIIGIAGHEARIKKGNVKITDQGILWEGALEIQVLYQRADLEGGFASAEILIPFEQFLEVPEIKKEDSWKVSEQLEQLMVTYEEEIIVIQGVLCLHICVLEQCEGKNITGIEAGEEAPEERQNRPGMLIHFVQPGENLWDIAKEHRISMEVLRADNELGDEEVKAGQKLLLLYGMSEELAL